eukprot:Rmarinus@m.10719
MNLNNSHAQHRVCGLLRLRLLPDRRVAYIQPILMAPYRHQPPFLIRTTPYPPLYRPPGLHTARCLPQLPPALRIALCIPAQALNIHRPRSRRTIPYHTLPIPSRTPIHTHNPYIRLASSLLTAVAQEALVLTSLRRIQALSMVGQYLVIGLRNLHRNPPHNQGVRSQIQCLRGATVLWVAVVLITAKAAEIVIMVVVVEVVAVKVVEVGIEISVVAMREVKALGMIVVVVAARILVVNILIAGWSVSMTTVLTVVARMPLVKAVLVPVIATIIAVVTSTIVITKSIGMMPLTEGAIVKPMRRPVRVGKRTVVWRVRLPMPMGVRSPHQPWHPHLLPPPLQALPLLHSNNKHRRPAQRPSPRLKLLYTETLDVQKEGSTFRRLDFSRFRALVLVFLSAMFFTILDLWRLKCWK